MGALRNIVLGIGAECQPAHHTVLAQSLSRSWGSNPSWGLLPAAQPASLLSHLFSQLQEDEQDHRSRCLDGSVLQGPAHALQSRAHALLLCGRAAPPPGLLASALLTSCESYGDSLPPSLTTVRHVSFIRTLSVSRAHGCACTSCAQSSWGAVHAVLQVWIATVVTKGWEKRGTRRCIALPP